VTTGYRRAPCDSLVKPEDYQAHLDDCRLCAEGLEDTNGWPDDSRLDEPRRGQATSINRERYKP